MDPELSPAQMRKLARERQLARYGRVVDVALEEPAPAGAALRVEVARTDPARSAPIRARREGDALWLELQSPPRTKKNHGRAFGIRASTSYLKFRNDLTEAIAPLLRELQLPLPALAYNAAIRYYVDRYGIRADRPGLDQGLFDALVYAGVLTDDWPIRSTEGTPPPMLDPVPRVELLLTPLPGVPCTPRSSLLLYSESLDSSSPPASPSPKSGRS